MIIIVNYLINIYILDIFINTFKNVSKLPYKLSRYLLKCAVNEGAGLSCTGTNSQQAKRGSLTSDDMS